ncbi:MAG: hypothetical protein LPJ89_07455 [Hymenobacteraceae bacterium]|nr:hypothetical protein [Hymenobacteraceae bacterium]MDX5398053.1 hypothetical protein [Hymenobacteraceae bacterium]MDX5443602.1 hypothetical protein [Hymenobacteraceae bacterium]MDX5514124.1 hypothetical protein [Hymenobacteraceae bacterium]
MYKFSRILTCVALLAAGQAVQAQGLGNSPYSSIGIGDVNMYQGGIRNFSMGGTGVSSAHSLIINDINPALLFYNNTVAFELGVSSQLKKLKTTDKSQVDGNTNLHYMSFAAPITKRWSAAVGLKPVSTVDYDIEVINPVVGDPANQSAVKYLGSGGLSEVYFMHGVKIADGFTVGASASYVFGNIIDETTVQLIGDVGLQENRTVVGTRTEYSDFRFKAGANYRHKLTDKISMNIGGTYTLKTDMSAERLRVQQQRSNSTNALLNEVVLTQNSKSAVTLPQAFAIGTSIDNGRNWSAAIDVNAQQWSEFRSFNDRQVLNNSFSVGAGGEYTPDPLDTYLKRVTYRVGASYARTPLQQSGENIKDMALTWGFSLPIGEAPQPPELQRAQLLLAFALGTRGTTDANLIKENYFRFNIGVALNNRWFQKRRIN